jgi:ComEC/Rec2-related protein
VFYSQAQLRYRFGRPLYFLGLLVLFCVAFWNGLTDRPSVLKLLLPDRHVYAQPAILDGERVYLALRVTDYPVSVVTAAGRHYERVECKLLAYSPDGQQTYTGNENVLVYIAAGSGSGSGFATVPDSDFASVLGSRFGSVTASRSAGSPASAVAAGFEPVDTSESLLPGDVFMARSKTFLFRASEADASAKVNDVDSGNVGSMATDAFDYAEYMARRGFYRRAYVYDYKRMDSKLTLRERLLRLRVSLTAAWGASDIEKRKRTGDLLAGICLGAKSGLDKEVRECFNRVGAGHILAVSGLHVGALYGSLVWLLSLCGKLREERRYRKRPKVLPPVLNRQSIYKTYSLRKGAWVHVPALLLIWAYAMVVGLSTSVVRAALMLTVYGISKLRGYRAFGLNVLSIAALVLMVLKPGVVLDLGFQLSFASVLSLLLFFPIFRNFLSVRKTLPRYLWELFCASLAVQLGTLSLTLSAFGIVPLYSLFCNMLVVPLAALILYVFLLYLVLFGLGSLVAMGPFGSSGLFSMGCPADKSFLSTADAALQWAFTAVTDTLHFLADVLYKTVAFFDSLPYSPIEYVPNVIDLLLVLWCLAYVLLAHAVHTARQPTRQPQDGAQRRKIDKCSALKNRGLVKKSKKPCAPS